MDLSSTFESGSGSGQTDQRPSAGTSLPSPPPASHPSPDLPPPPPGRRYSRRAFQFTHEGVLIQGTLYHHPANPQVLDADGGAQILNPLNPVAGQFRYFDSIQDLARFAQWSQSQVQSLSDRLGQLLRG